MKPAIIHYTDFYTQILSTVGIMYNYNRDKLSIIKMLYLAANNVLFVLYFIASFCVYSAKEILFCFHLMPRHLNKNPSNLVIIEKVGLSGINIIHSIEIAAKILAASLWVNELLPRVPPKEGEKGENIR